MDQNNPQGGLSSLVNSNGYTNWKRPMPPAAVGRPSGPGGNWPMGGNPAPGGERPGTYGVQSPGAPDPRGNELPRYDGGGQMPPPTGGPLPPFQGLTVPTAPGVRPGSPEYFNPRFPGMGNSAVGTPSGPGGNWPLGGNPAPGGERPGTYGVGGPPPPAPGGERPGTYGRPYPGNPGVGRPQRRPFQVPGQFRPPGQFGGMQPGGPSFRGR